MLLMIASMEAQSALYLFVYFEGKGESEQQEHLRYALSDDGIHWHALNQNRPVVLSDTVHEEETVFGVVSASVCFNRFHGTAQDGDPRQRAGGHEGQWRRVRQLAPFGRRVLRRDLQPVSRRFADSQRAHRYQLSRSLGQRHGHLRRECRRARCGAASSSRVTANWLV